MCDGAVCEGRPVLCQELEENFGGAQAELSEARRERANTIESTAQEIAALEESKGQEITALRSEIDGMNAALEHMRENGKFETH